MSVLRLAVIGCGLMGQRHADIIRATTELSLTCVCDTDRERAIKAAKGAPVAESFDEVLERKDVDAVVLALPSYLHVPFGIQAAQSGKHVITEKPLSIDVPSGEQLLQTCKQNNVMCAVISQNRFADGNAAVWHALRSGELDSIVLARGSVKWFRHDEYYTQSDWRGRKEGEGGGVLMNQATHTLDLLLWFFGSPDLVVGLTHTSRQVLETEDVAVAMLRFPQGILATFEATTSAYPGFEERIEIHGPKASCILEKGKLAYWKHCAENSAPAPPAYDPPTPELDTRFWLFQRQYRNIARAIRGEEELVVKPEEALEVVRVTQQIYESQRLLLAR